MSVPPSAEALCAPSGAVRPYSHPVKSLPVPSADSSGPTYAPIWTNPQRSSRRSSSANARHLRPRAAARNAKGDRHRSRRAGHRRKVYAIHRRVRSRRIAGTRAGAAIRLCARRRGGSQRQGFGSRRLCAIFQPANRRQFPLEARRELQSSKRHISHCPVFPRRPASPAASTMLPPRL